MPNAQDPNHPDHPDHTAHTILEVNLLHHRDQDPHIVRMPPLQITALDQLSFNLDTYTFIVKWLFVLNLLYIEFTVNGMHFDCFKAYVISG